MAQKITASVGKGGKNQPQDVTIIQNLLNPFASQVGFTKLKTDGKPTANLEKAIIAFQTQVCGFRADGRVDPGKNTIKKLNAGPAKAKAEQKAEEKKVEKIKGVEQAKAVAKIKKDLEKVAKAQSVEASSFASLWSSIEKQATELYETYWADTEKKSGGTNSTEAPKQAKKISDLMCKEVQKEIDNKIKELDTGGNTYPGKVTGKIQGVEKRIIDVLLEVSSHYEGYPIKVVSGLRNKTGQASAMYNGWNGHLEHGKIYWFLRQSKWEPLRLELDAFVQAKNKAGFIKCMMDKAPWDQVSRHLVGKAVDITTSTDTRIIKALGMVLRYVREPQKNSEGIKCHHFDDRDYKFPIPDSIRKKFPK